MSRVAKEIQGWLDRTKYEGSIYELRFSTETMQKEAAYLQENELGRLRHTQVDCIVKPIEDFDLPHSEIYDVLISDGYAAVIDASAGRK